MSVSYVIKCYSTLITKFIFASNIFISVIAITCAVLKDLLCSLDENGNIIIEKKY